MRLQAKEHQGCRQPPEARREAGNRLSLGALEGTIPAHTDLALLASRTVRDSVAVILSNPPPRVCGAL